MSILTRFVDLVTFRDLPANRALPSAPPEVRSSYGSLQPSYQTNRPQWAKANVNTFVNEGFVKLALFFRCALAVSNAISTAPLKVYLNTGGSQKESQDTHAIRRLMSAPNYLMSESEFWAFVGIMLNTVGFCVIEKDRSPSGRVVALWPLRPDWVKEIPRELAPSDWEYRIPGRDPVTILARDVIVVTYAADPFGSSTGIGPAQALLREVGISNVMTDYVKLFFDEGAQPRYALIPRDKDVEYTQPEVDAVKAAWRQHYGGLLRSIDPAFLANIEDVKEIGFDLNEMAYPDLSKLTDSRICSGFGVPPIIVHALVGLEHATYSNYEQARKAFYEDTITPLWARLDGGFTRGLLTEFEDRPGFELGFDVSDVPALQADVTPTWSRSGAAIAQGWVTVNDGRREVGLPPVVGGDVFLRPLMVVEVPAIAEQKQRSNGHVIDVQVREVTPEPKSRVILGKASPEDVRGKRGILVAGSFLRTDDYVVVRLDGARGSDVFPAAWVEVEPSTRALGAGALYRLPMERRATLASAAKATIAKLGERFGPEVHRFLIDQGERVISDLGQRAGQGPTEWRVAEPVEWEEETRLLTELMRRLHIVAGETAFELIQESIGLTISWDLANPYISDVLNFLAKRVVDISETTRRDIVRVIDESLNEGKALQEIAERIRTLVTETYKGRAMAISRTETMMALNTASVRGYAISGAVSMVELLDNPLHDTDPGSDGLTCSERNNLIVALDRADHHISAEHVNGTLAIAPVLSTPLGQE